MKRDDQQLPGVIAFFDYARRYVETKEYKGEAEWCQSVSWRDQTPITFIQQYVWVVLCAAFKEQVARKIETAFWNAINCKHPDPFSFIKHPNKRKAIAVVMANTTKIFEDLKESADKLAYIRTLPYMGPALSCHLARDLGLDVVKPDIWLVRLAVQWGYPDPLALCLDIQRWRPELRIGTIDIILWRYCNLTGELY